MLVLMMHFILSSAIFYDLEAPRYRAYSRIRGYEDAVPQLSGLSICTVIWYASEKEVPHLLPRLG